MTTSVPISAMEGQISKLAEKKISDDVKRRLQNSDAIPVDIIWEIFKPLHVKTLARFVCLSKQYASMIRNHDFMKSYLIKSSTRPQGLMFTFKSERFGKHFFFSVSDPQNRGESSSSSAPSSSASLSSPSLSLSSISSPSSSSLSSISSSVATYHMKSPSLPFTTVAPSVHGLICHGPPWKLMVYNPSTRRSTILPNLDSQRVDIYHYLGYDPIAGDYKMLCMTTGSVFMGRSVAQDFRVLTLGNGNSWRVIENCPQHFHVFPRSPEICIDGVLYYGALILVDPEDLIYAVMSFDVRSEEFGLIKVPEGALRPKLTNYKGKLALMLSGFPSRINLWVLEDAAKHEWSKKLYVLPIMEWEDMLLGSFLGPFCATNAGEFVYACQDMRLDSFHVLYYDPEKNTVRLVNIEGISELELPLWDKESERSIISIFSGQVDNLMFL